MARPHTKALRTIRFLWLMLAGAIVISLPFAVIDLTKRGEETHVVAWFVAFVFVCITVPLSLFDISLHLRFMHNPALQIPLVRILWMVPVYSIDAFISLRFKDVSLYTTIAREAYEAYVIHSFMTFLVRFCVTSTLDTQLSVQMLPNLEHTVKSIISKKPPHKHMFPFCLRRPWGMTGDCEFFNSCRRGVAQYVVVRLVTAVLALILELCDVLHEGSFSPNAGYFYIAIVASISQGWAMYCLVLFYHVMHKELAPMKPLSKFAVVKAVIFFSFWQGVGIAILVKTKVIKQNPLWTEYTVSDVARGLQDFLVVVEMFIASVVHHFVFSYNARYLGPIPGGTHQAKSFGESIRTLFFVNDVAADVYFVADHTARDVTTVFRKPRATVQTLGDDSNPNNNHGHDQGGDAVSGSPNLDDFVVVQHPPSTTSTTATAPTQTSEANTINTAAANHNATESNSDNHNKQLAPPNNEEPRQRTDSSEITEKTSLISTPLPLD